MMRARRFLAVVLLAALNCGTAGAISPPTHVEVTDPGTGGTLAVSWTNTTEADLAYVRLYRSTAAAGQRGLVIDKIAGTAASDAGLVNGTTYYYVLRSVNAAGVESADSSLAGQCCEFLDRGPPWLVDVTVSTGLVHPGDVVQVTMRVKDDWSGVNSGYVYFGRPGYEYAVYAPFYASGGTDVVKTVTMVVPKFDGVADPAAVMGEWRVTAASLRDQAGWTAYVQYNWASQTYTQTVYDSAWRYLGTQAVPAFTQTPFVLTGVAPTDTKPPWLVDVTVSTGLVHPGDAVQVTMRVKDDWSGVNSGYVYFGRPGYEYAVYASFYASGGTDVVKTVTMVMPKFEGVADPAAVMGEWRVTAVSLTDLAGWHAYVSYNWASRTYAQTVYDSAWRYLGTQAVPAFTQTPFVLTGVAPMDTKPPWLVDVKVSTGLAHPGDVVTVTARIRDDWSGVGWGTVYFGRPGYEYAMYASFYLAGGTDTVRQMSLVVPKFDGVADPAAVIGEWRVTAASLRDQAGWTAYVQYNWASQTYTQTVYDSAWRYLGTQAVPAFTQTPFVLHCCGDGHLGATWGVPTGSADTVSPSAPAGLGVADVPGDEGADLRLSWSANPESDLKEYVLYRGTSAGMMTGAMARLAVVAKPGTTHQDSGLATQATYFYRLTARDQTGNESTASAEASASPMDEKAPAAPSLLTVSDVPGDEGTALRLGWAANTEPDLKAYRVYRTTGAGTAVGQAYLLGSFASGTTSLSDAGLAKRTTYFYTVTARDASGNESAPAPAVSGVPVDNLPPPAPATAAVKGYAEGRKLGVSWTSVAAADVGGYRVYRTTWAGAGVAPAWRLAALPTAAGTSEDAGLSDGVTYYYRVSALDDSGNESDGSPQASGTPQDTVSPLVPSGFSATDVPDDAGGVVKLAWGAGTEPDLAGYRLTRSKSSNGAWEKDEFLTVGVAGYLDVGLTDYVNYFYTLRAADRAGNLSASVMVSTMPRPSEVFVAPPPPPQASGSAPPLGRAAQVSWTIPPGGIGVVVCQSTISPVLQPVIYQGSGTALTQGGLGNGVTSWYTIRAVDGAGRLSPPVMVTVIPQRTAPLPPVENLVGTGGTVGRVSWSYPNDPDVQRAWVYVATTSYRTEAAFLVYQGTGTSLSFPALIGTTHYVTISVCGPNAHDLETNPAPEHCAEREAAVAGPPAPPPPAAVAASTTTAPPGNGSSTPTVSVGAGLAGSGKAAPPSAPPFGTAKAVIKVPQDGKRVRGNAVTVVAESADQPKGVLFQFRAEKAQDWRDVASRDDKPPYAVYWNVSALANGSYRIRAVAYDSANRPDPAPAEVTVVVDDVNADVVEDGNPSVDPNKPHRKEEKVSEDKDAVVVVGDGTKVEVPKGAIKGSASLTVKVVPPAEIAHLAPPKESTLQSAGVYREFAVSGQTTFDKPVTITLPYADEDNDGVVDGTSIKKDDLRVHFRNDKTGEWEEVRGAKQVKIAHAPGEPAGALGAALYPQGHAVAASVDHFTLFGLFARAAKTDLADVIAYPNPCVPGQGRTGITFDGLPAGPVRIRIYTVSGRTVRDASVESAGTWIWNLTTDDGEPAVAGAYLYVVAAPGLGTAKGKIALVR